METKDIIIEYLIEKMDEETWKNISEQFPWTEPLLEKYQNEVYWNRISYNSNIIWTTSMLEKFKNYINWDIISYCNNKTLFTSGNLERYREYWDWQCLSESQELSFSYELIDKFLDKWKWEKLINNYSAGKNIPFCKEFLNRYIDHIPILKLLNSHLWDCIINEQTENIRRKILE